MKTVFYIILPIVAFLLILTNALYGHLLFVSTTDYVTTKYSVYVHLQPEWHSSSKNIIFDVTNSWYKSKDNKTNNVVSDSKEYNSNQLQFINGKSYVELKHSFSNCQKEWQPITYGKAVDTVRHEIEYVQGNQLSTDPDISVYPDIENTNYDKSQQQIKIKNGYVQFIPICTTKDTTSYDYSIKTDNNDLGFDIYFVSSSIERNNFSSDNVDYYKNSGCFAQNKQSYSGTCNNVEKNGGLIIAFPDELKPWVTKVTVNLYEKKY